MDKGINKWVLVAIVAGVAFIAGRHSKNVSAMETTATDNAANNPVMIINGQPTYNIQMSTLPAVNQMVGALGTEYMPLFGFVATRTAY